MMRTSFMKELQALYFQLKILSKFLVTYIFLEYLKFEVFYMTSQWGRVPSKECYSIFTYIFWHFFVVFHQKNCIFVIFISFFDEKSYFRNRILTNQRHELVIRNSQWNGMFAGNELHVMIWYYLEMFYRFF